MITLTTCFEYIYLLSKHGIQAYFSKICLSLCEHRQKSLLLSDAAYTEKHTCTLSGTLSVSLRMLLFLMDSGHKLRCRKRKLFSKNLATLCNNHKEHQYLLYTFSKGLYQGRLKFNGKIKMTGLGFGSNSNTIHFFLTSAWYQKVLRHLHLGF